MDLFTRLFGNLLVLVYHCFDRIVIHGYLSGLSRPEQVVHFVRQVHGIPVVSKEVLSQRTHDYQTWVEVFARNHQIPMEWAEKGLRKEDYVLPALRRLEKQNAYGVYFTPENDSREILTRGLIFELRRLSIGRKSRNTNSQELPPDIADSAARSRKSCGLINTSEIEQEEEKLITPVTPVKREAVRGNDAET